jgi:hypothetical protein
MNAMKDLKFMHSWAKTRERGPTFYILEFTIEVPVCSIIGKVLGEYIAYRVFFRPFHVADYTVLIFLCLVGICLGLYWWRHNERRYKELMATGNQEK